MIQLRTRYTGFVTHIAKATMAGDAGVSQHGSACRGSEIRGFQPRHAKKRKYIFWSPRATDSNNEGIQTGRGTTVPLPARLMFQRLLWGRKHPSSRLFVGNSFRTLVAESRVGTQSGVELD
jgi:hypothetical protein